MEKTDEKYIKEVRDVIVKCSLVVLFVFITVLLCFHRIYRIIAFNFGIGGNTFVFGITNIFNFYITSSFLVAVLLSTPLVIYMVYSYIQDTLFPGEKKVLKKYFVVSFFLFILGFLASFFLFPRIFQLAVFLSELLNVKLLLPAEELFTMWLFLALFLAVLSQIPLLVHILIKLRVVKKKTFRSLRKYFFALFFIISMILTPGDVLVVDFFVTGIMVLLYEAAIFLSPDN